MWGGVSVRQGVLRLQHAVPEGTTIGKSMLHCIHLGPNLTLCLEGLPVDTTCADKISVGKNALQRG